MSLKYIPFIACIMIIAACNDKPTNGQEISSIDSTPVSRTYGEDAAFLKQYNRHVIELESEDGLSKVLLSADYQGRVMTSTTNGDSGTSFGWINYTLIESRKPKQQFNPVGGEERFWLGPEGGQYALYFKKGDSFSINNWQVPPLIDTTFFDVADSLLSMAIFTKQSSLTNYAGNSFDLKIERKISLLDQHDVATILQVNLSDSIRLVAYRSANEVQNTGKEKWTQNKGLLSIWLLGMFNPSPKTFVIIPFKNIPGARTYITDDYFGKIPDERLTIKDSVLYFKCDGQFRSKIGLSPLIAKPLAASFDFQKNVLTVISFPVHTNGLYVNSKWEQQQFPYKGDVVNAYNDGPLPDGSQLGMFYELESSSHALELAPGESLFHGQVTIHFEGSYNQLRSLAMQLLGFDLNDINPALK